MALKSEYRYEVLSKNNWNHFEDLLGERGGCGGCWCMAHRLKTSVYNELKGEGNHRAQKELVWEGKKNGLLLFCEDQAIGWISIAPREEFYKIENSRIYKRNDTQTIYSITCFFVRKDLRRKGISHQLIEAALDYSRCSGIKVVEAYPVIPYAAKMPDAFAWTGIYSVFQKAGFFVYSNKSKSKPLMRYTF